MKMVETEGVSAGFETKEYHIREGFGRGELLAEEGGEKEAAK